ncbi:hypothetical protein G6F46_004640 [Rhizopus delemar]|uniref:Uncharacterized protein n=2 Tax=Rhizopus TaxID=4842 RepID=A0A9P7CRJ7_9FUNG|nr:hypothetical protein G6F55_003325 [Rhizopus delemar]KAG1549450.1 hypothetical protein G6F51_003050 [Rhizopus arrhizus]KAG1500097.1 hypothetical protein G6F54_003950 [Rhizopus delemar]KAG1513812.1 hypothetical protein G6F53_004149 [Rhizopus delemar]KAG1528912.1 hypothetical protein G6F52_000211 [Rhizopus delemar]
MPRQRPPIATRLRSRNKSKSKIVSIPKSIPSKEQPIAKYTGNIIKPDLNSEAVNMYVYLLVDEAPFSPRQDNTIYLDELQNPLSYERGSKREKEQTLLEEADKVARSFGRVTTRSSSFYKADIALPTRQKNNHLQQFPASSGTLSTSIIADKNPRTYAEYKKTRQKKQSSFSLSPTPPSTPSSIESGSPNLSPPLSSSSDPVVSIKIESSSASDDSFSAFSSQKKKRKISRRERELKRLQLDNNNYSIKSIKDDSPPAFDTRSTAVSAQKKKQKSSRRKAELKRLHLDNNIFRSLPDTPRTSRLRNSLTSTRSVSPSQLTYKATNSHQIEQKQKPDGLPLLIKRKRGRQSKKTRPSPLIIESNESDSSTSSAICFVSDSNDDSVNVDANDDDADSNGSDSNGSGSNDIDSNDTDSNDKDCYDSSSDDSDSNYTNHPIDKQIRNLHTSRKRPLSRLGSTSFKNCLNNDHNESNLHKKTRGSTNSKDAAELPVQLATKRKSSTAINFLSIKEEPMMLKRPSLDKPQAPAKKVTFSCPVVAEYLPKIRRRRNPALPTAYKPSEIPIPLNPTIPEDTDMDKKDKHEEYCRRQRRLFVHSRYISDEEAALVAMSMTDEVFKSVWDYWIEEPYVDEDEFYESEASVSLLKEVTVQAILCHYKEKYNLISTKEYSKEMKRLDRITRALYLPEHEENEDEEP